MRLIGFNVFSGSNLNWKTRMFAPADGIGEDHAAGYAVGPQAFHRARRRRIAWGSEIRISQGEEIGRPGKLCARVTGGVEQIERIEVGDFMVSVGGGWFDSNLLR